MYPSPHRPSVAFVVALLVAPLLPVTLRAQEPVPAPPVELPPVPAAPAPLPLAPAPIRPDEPLVRDSSAAARDSAAVAAAMVVPALRDTARTTVVPAARTIALTPTAVRSRVRLPIAGGVGPGVLHVQVLLTGAGFSPGVLDGHWAANTRGAVRAFRQAHGLGDGEVVDEATYRRLRRAAHDREPVVAYTLTAADVRGPFRTIPASKYAQARLDCLCYSTVEEKLAERFHTTPGVLRQLNPAVDLATATAGTVIEVPNMWRMPPATTIARLVVDKQASAMTAFDSAGAPVSWFPVSVGSTANPSPTGQLRVLSVTLDPWYRYDPRVLRTGTGPRANLPPGPNSPVGTVWIQLSRAHIGIHGVPDPTTIGRAGSNGCVRLTNWDARYLAGLVGPGVQVELR